MRGQSDFLIRREACRLAAQAIQGPWSRDRDVAHTIWSLTVFFDEYMRKGPAETRADFGPKDPINLGLVRAPKQENAS